MRSSLSRFLDFFPNKLSMKREILVFGVRYQKQKVNEGGRSFRQNCFNKLLRDHWVGTATIYQLRMRLRTIILTIIPHIRISFLNLFGFSRSSRAIGIIPLLIFLSLILIVLLNSPKILIVYISKFYSSGYKLSYPVSASISWIRKVESEIVPIKSWIVGSDTKNDIKWIAYVLNVSSSIEKFFNTSFKKSNRPIRFTSFT